MPRIIWLKDGDIVEYRHSNNGAYSLALFNLKHLVGVEGKKVIDDEQTAYLGIIYANEIDKQLVLAY